MTTNLFVVSFFLSFCWLIRRPKDLTMYKWSTHITISNRNYLDQNLLLSKKLLATIQVYAHDLSNREADVGVYYKRKEKENTRMKYRVFWQGDSIIYILKIQELGYNVSIRKRWDVNCDLERTRRVVDASMNDFTVARAGAGAKSGGRVEDHNLSAFGGKLSSNC